MSDNEDPLPVLGNAEPLRVEHLPFESIWQENKLTGYLAVEE
ncbi:unnamed protein product [marine sediment metagenome]|uniref:Uncharacterized protein n=1 Tax=marine sediment metagenome TaxID=412755 RepID=X1VH33_9ZZZZ